MNCQKDVSGFKSPFQANTCFKLTHKYHKKSPKSSIFQSFDRVGTELITRYIPSIASLYLIATSFRLILNVGVINPFSTLKVFASTWMLLINSNPRTLEATPNLRRSETIAATNSGLVDKAMIEADGSLPYYQIKKYPVMLDRGLAYLQGEFVWKRPILHRIRHQVLRLQPNHFVTSRHVRKFVQQMAI